MVRSYRLATFQSIEGRENRDHRPVIECLLTCTTNLESAAFMYTWMTVASATDLALLDQLIDLEYAPKSVAKKLTDGLSDAVKGILIERNYIDKDYRSTYYNFYAKKGLRYRPDCVRLHFFDETVAFHEKTLKLTSRDDRLTDHYFGFMVLRPTGESTIGRSVVTPDVRRRAGGYIITAGHKVHVLGHTLAIRGFPSMDQHRDVSRCAHAACWSILRHYSERYKNYREYLTHDITLMSQQFDPGGLVPSKGLALPQAERVFQEAGTYPVIVARELNKQNDVSFYRQLTAYVDSGFPLFAAMHNRGHAMAVVGYEWRTPLNTGLAGMRYSSDEIKTLAVVDDNHLPYLSIPADGGPYSAKDIDSFIVALPEKVFYPADAFDTLVPKLFRLGKVVQLPPQDTTIIRYFITTASAFRSFVRSHESEFDPQLLSAVMKLPFAQFLWIVELATETQWAINQISARAVIDATASHTEHYPYWVLHGRKEALIFWRDSVSLDLQNGLGVLTMADIGTGFSRMDTNLRPTQTK